MTTKEMEVAKELLNILHTNNGNVAFEEYSLKLIGNGVSLDDFVLIEEKLLTRNLIAFADPYRYRAKLTPRGEEACKTGIEKFLKNQETKGAPEYQQTTNNTTNKHIMKVKNIRGGKEDELKQLLCSKFDDKINIKLHYSKSKADDFKYEVYKVNTRFFFWKLKETYLGSISLTDMSLPFHDDEWEDLKIVILDRHSVHQFREFAKDYETQTGKKVIVIK